MIKMMLLIVVSRSLRCAPRPTSIPIVMGLTAVLAFTALTVRHSYFFRSAKKMNFFLRLWLCLGVLGRSSSRLHHAKCTCDHYSQGAPAPVRCLAYPRSPLCPLLGMVARPGRCCRGVQLGQGLHAPRVEQRATRTVPRCTRWSVGVS